MPSRPGSVCLTLACLLHAAASAAGPASIHGVTTRNQTTRLPGVEVIVIDPDRGVRVASVIADDNARFELGGLDAGRYRIVARLAGFVDLVRESVVLAEDQNQEIDFDLAPPPSGGKLSMFGERERADTTGPRDGPTGAAFDPLPVAGEELRPMFPARLAVIRAMDGRLSLNGVHDADSGRHVGRAYLDDPSVGHGGVDLPATSAESVVFVANPYGADGREPAFAAVRFDTRSGGDLWSAAARGFVPMPCLKLCDGASIGVRTYRPSGWFGGPLVKKRLFLGQSLQFRLARVHVPTQPAPANDMRDWGVEAFTRADVTLAPGHRITARVSAFPRHADDVGLSTFLPASAAPQFDLAGSSAGVSAASTLTASLFLESAFSAHTYTVDVGGRGQAPMELTIDGASGNFFNTQTRRTRVLQWTGTLAGVHRGVTGEHLWRGGVDMTWASFDGASVSRPVIVRRADGTSSEQLTFGAAAIQHRRATGGAIFIQDRWRMTERVAIEPGLRVERDGIARQTSVSPRVGLIASLFSDGSGIVRGGAGVFHEPTPLNRGVFDSYETTTVMRFADDGVSLRAPPSVYVHRTSGILTPRTILWNLEYDHRLRPDLLLKVQHLRRSGSRLAVVDPIGTGPAAALVLDTHGRSRYAETEVGIRLGTTDLQQVAIAYVRSHSEMNLNVFDAYFGTFRNPIVRADEYSLAQDDVPNRVLVRTVVSFLEKWTVSTLTEVRNGLPYSVVDQDQQFVGARNRGGRFPNLWTVDAAVVRSARFLDRPVQIGLRAFQVLDTFQPRDVQNNIDSPAFGTFYNSIPRRLSMTVTFFAR